MDWVASSYRPVEEMYRGTVMLNCTEAPSCTNVVCNCGKVTVLHGKLLYRDDSNVSLWYAKLDTEIRPQDITATLPASSLQYRYSSLLVNGKNRSTFAAKSATS